MHRTLTVLTAFIFASLAAHAAEPPHILLREALQFENIGDSGRVPLRGELPSPLSPPAGCAFHTRCPFADGECAQSRPAPRIVDGRLVACHHAERIG